MSMRNSFIFRWRAAILVVIATLPSALTAQQSGNAALAGDAARGKPLFADTYNCYACHGFDAQTGERRLVPMNFPQEAFILFVQNSPLPQMPAYPDVSAQDLADIYAYIRSIPVDAPAFADVPLLNAIRDRKKTALGN
jgi:mono/diheme cytochrome c family protein